MIPDLEQDLLNNIELKRKCRYSQVYSQNLYAALCNNRFFYGDKEWTCSWRYAGGLVSQMNDGNDYMDFYCSGISGANGYVSEGFVTEEIRLDLVKLGWIVKPYER